MTWEDFLSGYGAREVYDQDTGQTALYMTDNEGNSSRVHNENMDWLKDAYAQANSTDAQGRPIFGTQGPGAFSRGRAISGQPVNINGTDYTTLDYGYDDLMASPQYANYVRQSGVTPQDFSYDATHGYIRSNNERTAQLQAMLDAQQKRASDANSALSAFSQTIGLAMGIYGGVSALGNLAAAGSALGSTGEALGATSGLGAAGEVAGGSAGVGAGASAAGDFALAPAGAGIGGVGTAANTLQIPASIGGTAGGLGLGATGAGALSTALLTPELLQAAGAQLGLPGLTAEQVAQAAAASGISAPATGALTLKDVVDAVKPFVKGASGAAGAAGAATSLGSTIAGAVGALTNGGSNTTAATQNAQQVQSQIAQQMANMTADQFEFYRNTYRPVEEALASDSLKAGSLQSQEDRASQAGSTVTQQFSNARAAEARRQAGLGLNPASGNSLASFNQSRIAEAGSAAGAENSARQQEREYGLNARLAASGVGRGIASNAVSSAGAANSAAGGAASTAVTNAALNRQQSRDIGTAVAGLVDNAPNAISAFDKLTSGSPSLTAPASSGANTVASPYSLFKTDLSTPSSDDWSFKRGGLVKPRRRYQGKVKGPGTGTSDSIPVMIDGEQPGAISNGEFVVRAAAVKKLGQKTLDYINRTGKLPAPKRHGR